MKISIHHVAVAAVCAALAGCGDNSAPVVSKRDPSVLVLVTNADIPPYSYVDKKTGQIVGIDIDIVKKAAEKLDKSVDIRETPFVDMLPMVKNGEADIAAGGITITEGRRLSVDFSLPFAVGGSAFLYRAGEPRPTMITIERLRVAAVESLTQDFYLARHGIDPIRCRSIQEAVEALYSNRVDVVAYDLPAIKMIVEESGGRLAVTPLETRELYGIAVSKALPDVLAAINEVVEERRRMK